MKLTLADSTPKRKKTRYVSAVHILMRWECMFYNVSLPSRRPKFQSGLQTDGKCVMRRYRSVQCLQLRI